MKTDNCLSGTISDSESVWMLRRKQTDYSSFHFGYIFCHTPDFPKLGVEGK